MNSPATDATFSRAAHLQRMLGMITRVVEDEFGPELPVGRLQTQARMAGALLRFVIRELGVLETPLLAEPPAKLVDTEGAVTPEALAAIRAEQTDLQEAAAIEAQWLLPKRPAEQEALLKFDEARLSAYLLSSDVAKDQARVTGIAKLFGGFSKETYIVTATIDGAERKLVMRRDTIGSPVETSVRHEYKVIDTLTRAGLAVPEPIALETDEAVFGQAFALTEWRPGSVASNTHGVTMSPEMAQAARELAAFLGKLHALDPVAIGLDIARPELSTIHDHVLDQIAIAEASWRARSLPTSPTVAAGFAWLKANLPDLTGETPRIVHGDAGLHNIMIHDGRTSAMLDWELTHIGDPTEDLAYCRTWVDQVLPWQEFLDIYYASGGPHYRDEREAFYGILADLRVAVMSVNCVSVIDEAEHPEIGWGFGRVFYLRFFVGNVAERLMKIAAGGLG